MNEIGSEEASRNREKIIELIDHMLEVAGGDELQIEPEDFAGY